MFQINSTFGNKHCNWGHSRVIEIEKLLRPNEVRISIFNGPNKTQGFVKDNKVAVEARISVRKVQYFRYFLNHDRTLKISKHYSPRKWDIGEFDFAQSTFSTANVSVKLEDGIVYVCRRVS